MLNQEDEELKNLEGEFGNLLLSFFNSTTNREIYLSTDLYSEPQLRLLFKSMEFNESIHVLIVMRSGLKDSNVEDLFLALDNNETLYRLEVEENKLTD